jgi:hypothetical protein
MRATGGSIVGARHARDFSGESLVQGPVGGMAPSYGGGAWPRTVRNVLQTHAM